MAADSGICGVQIRAPRQERDRKCPPESFMVDPSHVVGKGVDFHGYTIRGRLELAHHGNHPLMHPRMIPEVGHEVCPERTQVSHMPAIH